MSGGSLGYISEKLEDVAAAVGAEPRPAARAFELHLRKVAQLLHEVEWALSNDTSWDDERLDDKIYALIGPGPTLTVGVREALNATATLTEALTRMREEVRLSDARLKAAALTRLNDNISRHSRGES